MKVGTTRKRLLVALAFLLPNLLGFLAFTAGPMVGSFAMSLTDLQLTKHNEYSDVPAQFVGTDNYADILVGPESERFWQYFGNTLFLMLGIPLGIAGSLVVALLITAKIPPARAANRARLSLVVLGVTLAAAGVVWAITSAGTGGMADAVANGGGGAGASTQVMSTETGLTDLPAIQVQRLRATAATLATLGVGGIAILGLTFGSHFFRTAYYLPSLLAGVPMFLLWKTLYRPDGGVVNAALNPLIDTVHRLVTATPAWLWQGLAVLVGTAGVALSVRLLWTGLRSFLGRDTGPMAMLGRTLITATLLSAIVGLTVVLFQLPEMAERAAAAGIDGFEPPEWLVSSAWAKPALVLMGVWLGVGGANMLLYIAGLSNIPPELYEAADIDGAAGWQRFINITWPQLAPTTFFIVIMSTIGGLQGGFEQALIMTGGLYDTTVLTYYIYNLAFTDEFRLGLASAVAWVMFAMIFVMTVINYRLGSRMTND